MKEQGTMGTHGASKISMFWYNTANDEFEPQSNVDALVQDLCDKGANICSTETK
jgi:hypothetical protein